MDRERVTGFGFVGRGNDKGFVYKGEYVNGLTEMRTLGHIKHNYSFFYDPLFPFDLEVFWKQGQRRITRGLWVTCKEYYGLQGK
jgi:hypothetical protein